MTVHVDDARASSVQVSNVAIRQDDSRAIRDGLHDRHERLEVRRGPLIHTVNDPSRQCVLQLEGPCGFANVDSFHGDGIQPCLLI